MNEQQKTEWQKFKNEFNPSKFKAIELKPMFKLHAEVFKHKYYEVCTCNGKEVKSMINQLDKQFDRNDT